MKSLNKGYLLILGAFFAGTIFYLLVEYSFKNFNLLPANAVFWGSIGAIIASSPFFIFNSKYRNSINKTVLYDRKLLILVATLTSVGLVLSFLAISESNSGVIALLFESKLLWAFLLGIFFLNEKISMKEAFLAITSVFGFFLICSIEGEITKIAIVAALSSNFLYALQSFFIKKHGREMDTIAFSFLRGIIIIIFIGVYLVISGKFATIPLVAFGVLTVAQICGLLLHKMLFFQAHKYLELSKLSIFLLLQPVLVLFAGFMFFSHPLSSQKIIGAFLILGSLALFCKEQTKIKSHIK